MESRLGIETHTHSEYWMVQIWLPNEGTRQIESWGPGIIPDKGGDVDPGGESADSQRFQADGGPIPGNSQRCSARYKFPRRQQR